MTSLASLSPGARARLVTVGGERSFRRRLLELGLLPGTNVRVVRRVDVGHLIEVEVGGGFLSLRQAEAAQQEEAVPAKPLTFYEKMQLQAAKTEKSLDDYRQMTDMAMSKGIYAGEAEMARVKAARAAEGESKE